MLKRQLMTVAAIAAMMLAATGAKALTETVNGITWTYTVSNGKASVGGGSYSSTAVPTSTSGAITIPSTLGGYMVTSIGNYAFADCIGLTSATIPDIVTSIGECAFINCSGLTSVMIGNGVTSIGNCAFSGCSGLSSFSVGAGNTKYSSVNGLLVSKDGKILVAGINGDVVIPNCVTSIGNYAFDDCIGLTSVTIPDSVTTIGYGAFCSCSGVTSLTIGNSVTNIGESVFLNCSGLTSLTIGNGVTSIGERVFSHCSGLTSLTIPDSVTSIGFYAFISCSELRSVTIGRGVTNIDGSAFENCYRLSSVHVSDLAMWCGISFTYCNNIQNPLYYAKHLYVNGAEITNLIIPDGVTSIGSYAFHGCSGLTSVTIPNSVTNIGVGAFSRCSGLTSVTIPNSITSTGERVFYNCSGLTSVTIPSSVTSIGNYAFYGCSGLSSVTIPGSMTNIGSYAFYGCSGLLSVTIPDSVTSIGSYAFSSCSGLTSLTVGNNVANIGDYAFRYCGKLISMVIPDSVTSIGRYAFQSCGNLKNLYLPKRFEGYTYDFGIPSGCEVTFVDYGSSFAVTISFDQQGGSGGSASATAIYGATMPSIYVPTRTGYTFGGYWTEPDGGGTQYYTASGTSARDCGSTGNATLYAKWTANTYSVTLDRQGGSGGSTSVTATYGTEMPAITIPTRTGYTFGGYYTSTGGSGTQYYTASGASACDWNKATATRLYAKWTLNTYSVSFDYADGKDMGWGNYSAIYGTAFRVIEPEPARSGFVFIGWSVTAGLDSATAKWGTTASPAMPIDGASSKCVNWEHGDVYFLNLTTAANGSITLTANWEHDEWPEGIMVDRSAQTPNAGWSVVADAGAADGYVFRSNEIGAGETAGIEATVEGLGRLEFDWRISANRGDYARIYVDGVQKAQITRSTAWANASIAIGTRGLHTVRWEYDHRASKAANDNAAFLDNVAWHPLPPMTLAEALDSDGLIWTTDEGAEWTAQLTETSDGEDAAVSGPVDDYGVSGLETTVFGPGTLAWHWKLAVEDVSGLDVIVDGDFGDPARAYEESGDWAEDSLAFDDDGTHTIRFEFWNLGSVEGDCAYLDCVSWVPASAAELIPSLATNAAPEAVTNAIESAGFNTENAATLQDAISGDAAKYNEFKTWAQAVKGGNGEAAGEAAVVASERAAISYLLGTNTLLAEDIESDDVHITGFSIDHGAESGGGEMQFSFEVAIDGVEIGSSGAIASVSLKENLKKAIGIEGATRLDGEFSPANIELTFDAPVDGKARFTATPPPDAGDSFFMRANVK